MRNPTQEQILARAAELRNVNLVTLPLGAKENGKAALVKGWQKNRLTQTRFDKLMISKGSTMYGVRLDDMVVLDLDEKDPELVDELEARFGTCSVKVATPRGIHLYYSGLLAVFPDLKAEGLAVDVLSGSSSYTVGPLSTRPCGGRYVEMCGTLGETKLNPFQYSVPQVPSNALTPPTVQFLPDGKVAEGYRHPHMRKLSVRLVALCQTFDELFENLLHARDDDCSDPKSFPDTEVFDIAKWAFDKHDKGKLYGSTRGVVKIDRRFIDILSDDSNALTLYVILQSNFGHITGKTFKLIFNSMKEASLINMSERGFVRALEKLIKTGAIEVVQNYSPGKSSRTFALGKVPRIEMAATKAARIK